MNESIANTSKLADPFAAAESFGNYYEDNKRHEFLLQLVHLTEFTNTILFIVGELESGKTALLQQFVNLAGDEWILCVTSAAEVTTTVSLMRKLSQDFKLPGLPHSSVNQTFIEQLSLSKQKGHTPVLIIDDADKLSAELLDTLLHLSTNIFQVDLRIILAGREIPSLLQQMDDSDERGITELPLPAFTELQTAEYIASRLSLSDIPDVNPFTQDLIHKIHKQSKGQPGHINVLASTILKESLMKPDKLNIPFGKPSGQQSALKLIALALGISVVLSVYLFNTGDDDVVTVDDLLEQTLTPGAAGDTVTKSLAIPEIETEKKIESDNFSDNDKVFASSNDEELTSSEKSTMQSPAILQSQDFASSNEENEAITKTEKSSKNKISNKSGDSGEAWINAQNPKHYTIQIISFASAQDAQEFIDKMGLAAEVHYFSFKKGDKLFFPVIIGEYSNKSLAVDGSKVLPKKLAKLKPWIRSFRSIQNLLSMQ